MIAKGVYRRRPIRFLDLWEQRDWSIKLYGISSVGEVPQPLLIRAARDIAESVLPQPARTSNRYGIAFVTVHEAEAFNQVIVDWWEHVNELRHRVFKSMPANAGQFEEITQTGEAFCIWELRVIGFERDAWISEVLQSSDSDQLDRYLACRLSEFA